MCRVKLALRSRFSFVDVRICPVIRGSVEEEKMEEVKESGWGGRLERGWRRGRVGGGMWKGKKEKSNHKPRLQLCTA